MREMVLNTRDSCGLQLQTRSVVPYPSFRVGQRSRMSSSPTQGIRVLSASRSCTRLYLHVVASENLIWVEEFAVVETVLGLEVLLRELS